MGYELPGSPFEFRALEVALQAICSFLYARTTELEKDAYPALDELTIKVCLSTSLPDLLQKCLPNSSSLFRFQLSPGLPQAWQVVVFQLHNVSKKIVASSQSKSIALTMHQIIFLG